MANVLVLGGNGFIGTHTVDSLLRAGHTVTAFDLFSVSPPRWSEPGAVVYNGDFFDENDVRAAVDGNDIVVFLLSVLDASRADDDPASELRDSVIPSIKLCEICVEMGVEHLYFASSGGTIYGDQADCILRENSPTFPTSPYAIGKLTVESYLRYFSRTSSLMSTALRISNPYGARQNPFKTQGVIPIFLRRVYDRLPLNIMGDGSMTRDYIFVNDLADIIACMITQNATQEIYNIGSGQQTSINAVCDSIAVITERSLSINHVPVPPTYIDHVALDVSRLNREFGPFSYTSLHEGIKQTWFDICCSCDRH